MNSANHSRRCLLLGSLLLLTTVAIAGPPTAPEQKAVLALQAFLVPDQEAALVTVWKQALAIPGVKCALTDRARPHVTFGSWKVTKAELADAIAKIKALDGHLPVAEFAPRPAMERNGYFLRPVDEPTLARYHATIHKQIQFTYEPYRPMDVPGQWWPHLTMFSAAQEANDAVSRLWAQMVLPARLKIASFGLVTFGPSTVVAEVRCATGE